MIDSIGTLRLSLPRTANAASQRRAAAAAAMSAFGPQNPAPSSAGERVVLVRNLRVRVRVAASSDIHELAATAARNVEPAMHDALKTADRDGEVLTFDSVAEYIVQFLEHYVSDRALDVWYFGPLAQNAALTLDATLSNLAEREPTVWPDVLELLRKRGMIPRLLQRLDPADYDLVYQPAPRARRLSADEGRPLFAAAFEIVAGASHFQGASTLEELQIQLARYLQQSRAAPASWSDASALSHVVAEMIRWLVERNGPARFDTGAGKLAAMQFTWLDQAILVDALIRATSHSNQTPASVFAPPLARAMSRVNRTRALRYLAAARQNRGRTPRAEPRITALNDAAATIEQIIATLQSRSDLRNPSAIERIVLDAGFDPCVNPRAAALIASLRAAATVLSRTEARDLVKSLQDAVREAPSSVQTSAAGLFLLIRPLNDLRVQGCDIPGFAEAAGVDPDDAAIEVFSHRPPGEVDRAALTDTLKKNARLLGLEADRMGHENIAAFALDLACQQLVRWLRGFEKSSVDYVVRTLIQRNGSIYVPDRGAIVVEWPGSALDVLLDRAGFLDPIEVVPWWSGRGLRWQR